MFGVVVEDMLEDDRRTINRSGRRTNEERSDGRHREYEWTDLWKMSDITDYHEGRAVRTTTAVGALDYEAGKGLQWAAKTPTGQRIIGSTMDEINKVPVVRDIAKRLGPNGRPANPEHVNLASSQRTTHILDGDTTGGGHRWPGAPGKTPFPRSWSDNEIMHNVSDVATDPNLTWMQQGGRPGATVYRGGDPVRYEAEGVRDGVNIKTIVQPGLEPIISSYPTQWHTLEPTPFVIAVRNEFSLFSSSISEE